MRWAILSLICIVAGSTELLAAVQWRVQDGGNGHHYDLIVTDLTWPQAKTAAGSNLFGTTPGHLVTFTDQAELEFVMTALDAPIRELLLSEGLDGIWAGMTDIEVEGEWRWIDDTPPDFVNWCGVCPNDVPPGEDYLSIRLGGVFNDYFNDRTLPAYLVEWDFVGIPGDTNGDGAVDVTDLNNVLNNFRLGELGGPPIPGDAFPFDGVVDLGDLNLVRNHFGTSVEAILVPELPTGIMVFLSVVALCAWRKSR